LAATSNEEQALSHLRVIELGDIPASYATRWLADLGADVIKVEPPGGDPNRLLAALRGEFEHPERSLTFIHANTNKRSIVLDLERDRARLHSPGFWPARICFIEATPLGLPRKARLRRFPFQEGFSASGDRLHHAVRPDRDPTGTTRAATPSPMPPADFFSARATTPKAVHGAKPSRLSGGRGDGGDAGARRDSPPRETGAGSASTCRCRKR
jgi:hypothetical protein